MKFRFEKKYVYWGVTAFLVIAASLIFYYLLFHMNNVRAGFRTFTKTCMPIIDGLVLAYLMTPLVKHMERDFFIPLCKRLNPAAYCQYPEYCFAASCVCNKSAGLDTKAF